MASTPMTPMLPVTQGYLTIYDSDATDRIGWVKAGLDPQILPCMAHDMRVSRGQVFEWTQIPPATAKRKIHKNQHLSVEEGERALGLAQLIGHVGKIVHESGDPTEFDPAAWTAWWLETPNPALGGDRPGQYMDTADGRALVSSLVDRMQSGAYA